MGETASCRLANLPDCNSYGRMDILARGIIGRDIVA